MDNNGHNNGHDHHPNFIHRLFDAHPQIGRTLNELMNAFMHQHTSQHPHPPPEDDPEVAGMPPLEPLSHRSSPDQLRHQSVTPAPAPTLEPNFPAPVPGPSAHPREQSLDYESDPLVSVSGSSNNVHFPDIEMLDADHVSESSSASFASRNPRRVRVEDDGDEDETRETNRQRMHPPLLHDEVAEHQYDLPNDRPQAEPHLPNQQASGAQGVAPNGPPPLFDRLVYTFDFFPQVTGTPASTNDASDAAHSDGQPQAQPQGQGYQPHVHLHPHPHPHPHHMPGTPHFNFTFHVPIVPAAAANLAGQGGSAEQNAAGDTQAQGMPQGLPDFAQLLQGLLGGEGIPTMFPFGFHGFPQEEEQDDPQRAKRLMSGLEVVPTGLVKRMERVGGSGSGEGESPVCVICWESLLDSPGRDDASPDYADHQTAELAATAATESREAWTDLDRSPSAASTQSEGAGPSSEPNAVLDTRIVVLPCSHVFHASCLLPWFSKPHRTTCPSCRFDIDPDSLTYVPRPRQSGRAAPGPVPAGSQPAHTQTQSPEPVPTPAAVPNAAPGTPNAASGTPNAAPGTEQSQNRARRPPPGPFITFDLSMIFPAGPPPGQMPTQAEPQPQVQPQAEGRAQQPRMAARRGPQFIPLDDQATRNLFERLFSPQPQPQGRTAAPGAQSEAGVPPPSRPMTAPPNARSANGGAATPSQPSSRRDKRRWSLPAAPGPTLRQRIERREREIGLRCSDVSCGLGPSDEDPVPVVDVSSLRQISIRPLKDHGEGDRVCEHTFHPSCLVSAERVAGWGQEDKKDDRDEEVEVSCPVCRAVGSISREDWEEGACALA